MANGGFGMALGPDGRVVMVPFAAVGDVVEVEVTRDAGRHIEAAITTVIEPGSGRVQPRCPDFARCGGCHVQHLSQGAQIGTKTTVLTEALHRIGRLETPSIEVVSGDPWGWRARIDLHWAHGHFGFYARHTRWMIEPEACLIARPALSALIPVLRRAVYALRPSPCDIEAIESADGAVVLAVQCRPAEAPWFADQLSTIPGIAGVDAGSGRARQVRGNVRVLWPTLGPNGSPGMVEQDARAFAQANAGLNPRLVGTIVDLAAPSPGEHVLELYAGAGNVTVPLAATGANVTAVEGNAAALADAVVATGGADGVRTIAGDAGAVAARLDEAGERFDVVVADPPRTGFGPGVAQAIGRLASGDGARVVVCSCDPATLARDLALVVAEAATHGRALRIDRAVVVDMFPQTWHIETVVRLASL